MTTPHTPDDERLPGEDELSSLYRKLPPIEPPAALDAAVRRAAAEAVKPPAGLRRRARWPMALSSAAALVIAAGLAWRMGQMPSKQDSLHDATTQREAQTITAPAQPMVDQEPAPVRPPRQAPPKIIMQVKPPPSPKPQARREQLAPPPSVEEASSNPVPASPPAPPAPPAPPTQIMPQRVDAAIAPARQPADAMRSAAPVPGQVMPAPMAPMPTEGFATPATVGNLSLKKADTPEQELQKIRALFVANQRDDARKRLADFHRDHPNYELPADLRDLLLQP
jgi:hypothetical protein